MSDEVAEAAERQEDLRREAWRAVYEAGDAIRQWIFAMAQSRDLSPAQAHLLSKLEPETPVPMSHVALLLGCDASNVTGLTDRLERRGLIERKPSPTDRRVKMLALTAGGAELRTELSDAFASLPSVLSELSSDELRALRDVMQRIASNPELVRKAGAGRLAGSGAASG